MKTTIRKLFVVLGVLLATVALAAGALNTATLIRIENVFIAGFYTGPSSVYGVTANKVTRMLGGSATIDFASATITTVDSTGITVTGAQVGDPCFVGPPAAIVANASFTCFVSAADTVKVRFTPAGTAADPASGTFFIRVISQQ